MQPHQEAARLIVLRFEAAALERLLADSAEVDSEVCRVIEADEAPTEEEPEP
jgi:hypothetical protein